MDKVSVSYVFFTLKISNSFFKFIFRQLMGKWKEGKVEIQKFEYLEKKKSFFDEIKNMLHSF